MITIDHNSKRYIRYVFVIVLFFIAGICQYFDGRVVEPWDITLGTLANGIYFLILILWLISIQERIVDKKIRKYLSRIAKLMLFLMITRFIKYNLISSEDRISRLLWYSYYITESLVPVLLLLCAVQIDKKENDIHHLWHLFFIPALIFIILFMTNDIHQLCFRFKPNFEGYESDYQHGIVFYLTMTYNALISLISIITLFYKCRISAVRKKVWLPITLFISTVVLLFFVYILNIDSYKIPEMVCLIVIALIESLIIVGFIPSNYNYKKYFFLSNVNALIADSNLNIFTYSNQSSFVWKQPLEEIVKKDLIIEDSRYRKNEIYGGYVFWIEDLSNIHYLNQEIQEIMNQLSGENDLLLARTSLEEEKARIEEQNRLYQTIDKTVRKQTKKIYNLLKETTDENIEYYLKLACIYTVYVKRRSNLIILHEKDNLAHIDELIFSIKESITYLSLYGVSCSLITPNNDKYYNLSTLEIIYDFIEECIEKALPSMNAIIIKITEKKNCLMIRICIGDANTWIDPNWNKEALSRYNGSIQVLNQEEDDNYALLSMEVTPLW